MNSIDSAATALLQHAPVGFAACDGDGRVAWANPALATLLGEEQADLLGRRAEDLLGPRAETVGEGVHRGVVSGPAGERRWLELRAAPLPADSGFDSVWCVTDITAFESRGRARAAVAAGIEASRIDAETGLLNRRATLQELNAQVSRSRRYGNPLSVLCVRLDGIEPGDADLRRRVAQHLRESLRWVDSAGVLDASSLVVVLPETDRGSAALVAGKVRERLAEDATCAAAAGAIAITAWAQPDDVNALLARLREPACETV